MNNIYSKFINKDCFVKLRDREETEVNGKILNIDSIGLIVSHISHGREYELFIPIENLAYLEKKIIAD